MARTSLGSGKGGYECRPLCQEELGSSPCCTACCIPGEPCTLWSLGFPVSRMQRAAPPSRAGGRAWPWALTQHTIVGQGPTALKVFLCLLQGGLNGAHPALKKPFLLAWEVGFSCLVLSTDLAGWSPWRGSAGERPVGLMWLVSREDL